MCLNACFEVTHSAWTTNVQKQAGEHWQCQLLHPIFDPEICSDISYNPRSSASSIDFFILARLASRHLWFQHIQSFPRLLLQFLQLPKLVRLFFRFSQYEHINTAASPSIHMNSKSYIYNNSISLFYSRLSAILSSRPVQPSCPT